MRSGYFKIGLVLIIIGIVGPSLPMGIFTGESIPYSLKQVHDYCNSILGQIGSVVSGSASQYCYIVSLINVAMNIALIAGAGLILYGIVSKKDNEKEEQ